MRSALEGVSFDILENEIFGIIGPANAGKTSFLKAVNRMDVFNPDMKVEGRTDNRSHHDIHFRMRSDCLHGSYTRFNPYINRIMSQ